MHESTVATHHGRNGLWQMVLFIALLVAAIYGFWSSIMAIYHAWTLTIAGLIINGFTVLLFLLGMVRIAWLLMAYHQEEVAIATFVQQWAIKGDIHGSSLIVGRYFAMQSLHTQQSPIHQGALASSLQAREKARTATLRYINNVLILCGVFGTIVSLSVALVGASGLLEGAVNEQGMGMVIHGMSTALSTTMTAIACYFFFHYFLVQVENARMAVLASIEHISTTLLAPVFHIQAEHIPYRMADLIGSLQKTMHTMEQAQTHWISQQEASQQAMNAQLLQLARSIESVASWKNSTPPSDEKNYKIELRMYQALQDLRLQQQIAHKEELAALESIITHLGQGFRLPEA